MIIYITNIVMKMINKAKQKIKESFTTPEIDDLLKLW